MLSSKSVYITVGGNVPGTNIRDFSPPYTYRLKVYKYSDEPFSFIDLESAVNLRQLVTAYYSKVSKIGIRFSGDVAGLGDPITESTKRLTYAQYWGNQIVAQVADAEIFYAGKVVAQKDQTNQTVVLIDFLLQIRWRDLLKSGFGRSPLNTQWVGAFPSYMDSEGTGYVLLDRDNNLDGPIKNINLTLVQDENYVRNKNAFTNIPLFSRTLFIRPKMKSEEKSKCKKKKEDNCEKYKKCCDFCYMKCCEKNKNTTTSTDLEYMVNYIYQNASDIVEDDSTVGEDNIKKIVAEYQRYKTEGTNLIFTFENNEDGVFITMCARFNLDSNNDCIVAFNMCTTDDNHVILKVSNVTVDEDMRDVIYPFIIPFSFELEQ